MISKVYSVRDEKAECFMAPFVLPSRGVATRSFGDAVNKPEGNLNQHPEDYILYEVAEWDDENGKFRLYEAPKMVVRALDMVITPAPKMDVLGPLKVV